jgi:HNH endonuclease
VTSAITAALRALVAERAQNRCEYCRLSQVGQEATFHVDHVVPRAAGGPTDEDNLALAYVGCSLRKGARRHATDPQTGADVVLFNPRRDSWSEHFRWDGVRLEGLSPTGRATAAALAMNRPLMVAIREEEVILGRDPKT